MLALREALPALEPGEAIGAILPDIVGEAALLRVFGEDGEGVVGGVPAAPRLVAVAQTAVNAASATLVRAAQDFAAAGRLEPIRWLEAWSEAPETDLGALIEIANALPGQTLALREMAVGLYSRIYNMIVEYTKISPKADLEPLVATVLNNLGNRLSALGRCEDALDAAREAVNTYRRLAAERPDAFMPDLARLLGNLGNVLEASGRVEGACVAIREAVETLAPHFLQRPRVHAGRMASMGRQYIARCEALKHAPDMDLLAPIAAALLALRDPVSPS